MSSVSDSVEIFCDKLVSSDSMFDVAMDDGDGCSGKVFGDFSPFSLEIVFFFELLYLEFVLDI